MNRLFKSSWRNKYKTFDNYLYYLAVCLLVSILCLILIKGHLEEIESILVEYYSKYLKSNIEYIELKRDGITYEIPFSASFLEERINPIHDFLMDRIGMLNTEQKRIRFSFNPELSTNVRICRSWHSLNNWQIIFRSSFEVKDSLILHELTHFWSPEELLENENFIVAEGFASGMQYLKYPDESLTLLYPQLKSYYFNSLCGFLSNHTDLRELDGLEKRLAYELIAIVFAEIYQTDPIMFAATFWNPPPEDINWDQFQAYMMKQSVHKQALRELLLKVNLFSPITQDLYVFPQLNRNKINGMMVFIGPLRNRKIELNKKEILLVEVIIRDKEGRLLYQASESVAVDKGYFYLNLGKVILMEDINIVEIKLQSTKRTISEQILFN